MSPRMPTPPCPLCGRPETGGFYRGRRRAYRRCPECRLVFVPPSQFVSRQREKAEYDLHRNDPHDPGYRRFLDRLFRPLNRRLAPGSRGMDFGCGPGPALAALFEESGHRMALYDPFYAPDPHILKRRYDFVTATEVVEHLHRPGRELDRLFARLVPGGLLGLMTKMVIDREAFSRWHYKNDPTHVCFFSPATFVWLSRRWQAPVTFTGRDVVIFRRRGLTK